MYPYGSYVMRQKQFRHPYVIWYYSLDIDPPAGWRHMVRALERNYTLFPNQYNTCERMKKKIYMYNKDDCDNITEVRTMAAIQYMGKTLKYGIVFNN